MEYNPTTMQELIGMLGVPGAIFFMVLTVAAGLWIRKVATAPPGVNGFGGAASKSLGRLEGVLDGLARSQEQLAAALRDLIREHSESRMTVEKVAVAIGGYVESASEYQRQGLEAMRKINDLYEGKGLRPSPTRTRRHR